MDGYTITLTPDDNGTLLATSVELPEVTTFGDDEVDALHHAEDAVISAIAARMAHGREIPDPSSGRGHHVYLPTLVSLKVALYRALRETGNNRAELARKLGWHREQVDRLFRLDHESKTSQIDAAMGALGRRLDVMGWPIGFFDETPDSTWNFGRGEIFAQIASLDRVVETEADCLPFDAYQACVSASAHAEASQSQVYIVQSESGTLAACTDISVAIAAFEGASRAFPHAKILLLHDGTPIKTYDPERKSAD